MSAYFPGENKLTTVQYFFRIGKAGEGRILDNDANDDELWKIYLPKAKVALTEKITEIIAAAD